MYVCRPTYVFLVRMNPQQLQLIAYLEADCNTKVAFVHFYSKFHYLRGYS